MQPDPERVDLSVLDVPHFERAAASVAERALALRRFRRVVTRRAVTTAVLVAAAAVMLWLSAPRRPPAAARADVLSWAVGPTSPEQVLAVGGNYAQ